jgi:uncharacterized protein (DUF1684 family)
MIKLNRTISSGKYFFFIMIVAMLTFSCDDSLIQKASPSYLHEINEWHAKRIENLKKENGWLNLVGLYWLKPGENAFGSANDNDIVFPDNTPAYIGTFQLNDSIVTIRVKPEVKVIHDSLEVNEMNLQHDLSGSPTVLKLDTFRWFILKRGDKYGVRLRDLNALLLKEFNGIERFPVNEDWQIKADFIPYDSLKKIMVPNILGAFDEEMVSGKLKFTLQGKDFNLDPIDSGDKLFIIFADETNGESTYGAGRFLYSDEPDSSGKVIIDFNKAYNPPCVFTKYATCPLPPEQNRLATKITAGEKNFGEH